MADMTGVTSIDRSNDKMINRGQRMLQENLASQNTSSAQKGSVSRRRAAELCTSLPGSPGGLVNFAETEMPCSHESTSAQLIAS